MNKKTYLTRTEFGEAVYQVIKAEIESRGFVLWRENFDPEYPVSLRTIQNIRKGMFKMDVLRKLPGIDVEEWFCLGSDSVSFYKSPTLTSTVTITTSTEQLEPVVFTVKGYDDNQTQPTP